MELEELNSIQFCIVDDPEEFLRQNPQIVFKTESNQGGFGLVGEDDIEKMDRQFESFYQEIMEEMF